MSHRPVLNKLLSFLTALMLAAGLAACGDDEGSSGSGQDAPIASPEDTIDAWFAAARVGDAVDKCRIETDRYQSEQYGGPGRPCLQDAANQKPQKVWATDVKIVESLVGEDQATVTVQPIAGTDDVAGINLTKVDGVWMIDSFR